MADHEYASSMLSTSARSQQCSNMKCSTALSADACRAGYGAQMSPAQLLQRALAALEASPPAAAAAAAAADDQGQDANELIRLASRIVSAVRRSRGGGATKAGAPAEFEVNSNDSSPRASCSASCCSPSSITQPQDAAGSVASRKRDAQRVQRKSSAGTSSDPASHHDRIPLCKFHRVSVGEGDGADRKRLRTEPSAIDQHCPAPPSLNRGDIPQDQAQVHARVLSDVEEEVVRRSGWPRALFADPARQPRVLNDVQEFMRELQQGYHVNDVVVLRDGIRKMGMSRPGTHYVRGLNSRPGVALVLARGVVAHFSPFRHHCRSRFGIA